jgi:magnesium transporter
VVNGQNVLVGIITHDDVIDVIHQTHIEDMEKFMRIFFSTAKWLLGI